jgi:hypothetical protein
MLNEFVYCPRLFYYEFVEGVFVESADTLRGAAVHSRVDGGKPICRQPMGPSKKVEGELDMPDGPLQRLRTGGSERTPIERPGREDAPASERDVATELIPAEGRRRITRSLDRSTF